MAKIYCSSCMSVIEDPAAKTCACGSDRLVVWGGSGGRGDENPGAPKGAARRPLPEPLVVGPLRSKCSKCSFLHDGMTTRCSACGSRLLKVVVERVPEKNPAPQQEEKFYRLPLLGRIA